MNPKSHTKGSTSHRFKALRTIHVVAIDPEVRDKFTKVMASQTNVDKIDFVKGTPGRHADPLTYVVSVKDDSSAHTGDDPRVYGALVEHILARYLGEQNAEERIADLLADLDEPVSHTTLRALNAHDKAWRDLADQWGTWSSAEIARAVGNTNKNPHDWATAQVRNGKLLAVTRSNRLVFPGYQVNPSTGAPSTVLPDILALLRTSGWDDDSIALWFTSPQGTADGAVPAEILHSDPQRVLAAATVTAAG
ncbi:hypothetical protein LL946_06370 [Knoellia locipacati]|uniref:hypothetical protein n=1 Tax=Knoellia locipacati TaxID=882824 RepID=UPI00384DB2E5